MMMNLWKKLPTFCPSFPENPIGQAFKATITAALNGQRCKLAINAKKLGFWAFFIFFNTALKRENPFFKLVMNELTGKIM